MKTLLTNAGIQLGSSAVAILLADILLSRFSLHFGGFITAIVVFTAAQFLLGRLVARWASKHVPAFAGLASLVSTLLALVMAAVPFGGIWISGLRAWILAALIIWVVTAVCAVLLPRLILKSSAR